MVAVRPLAALAAVGAVVLAAGCAPTQALRIEPTPASVQAGDAADDEQLLGSRRLSSMRNLVPEGGTPKDVDRIIATIMVADPRVPKRLQDAVKGCIPVRQTGCTLGDPVFADVTKDKVDDMLLQVIGSNEWQGAVVYTAIEGKPHLVFAYSGAKANVAARKGDLVLSEHLYAPGDAACCASGPWRDTRYTWNGHEMILRSVTNDDKRYAPYDKETKVVT